MKIFPLVFCSLLLFSCSQTKIFIVRHAEKNGTQPNADLKMPEGFARAETLRDSMEKFTKITDVYSTNVPRTLHTAEPLAIRRTLPVMIYRDLDYLLNQTILLKNRRVLVVGHSNTIPAALRHLGLMPGFEADIPDNDFDNLFIISVRKKKGVLRKTLVQKTYGVVSP